MKVLHININYPTRELHQTMIEHLSECDNTIYCATYDKKLTIINPNKNVIISECFKKRDRYIFDYKQKKIYQDIKKRLEIKTFDLIHAYTVFTDGNCAMKLSKEYGVPYVVAVRSTDVNVFFSKLIYLRTRGVEIIRNAAAVFFLSESYQKQVLDKYIPRDFYNEILEKSYVIPNGIDDFWLNKTPTHFIKFPKNQIKLVVACTIDKNKNLLTTQKAMEIIRNKGWKISLAVAGKICEKSVYKKLTSDSNIDIMPYLSKDKLVNLYRDNEIFVMPSFTETFGLVYAEAMSQGLPVIYSRGQGFDKQFEEGEVGYSTDSHNAQELAEKILKCKENYEALSQRALIGVQKFNWDNLCAKYYEIYTRILVSRV